MFEMVHDALGHPGLHRAYEAPYTEFFLLSAKKELHKYIFARLASGLNHEGISPSETTYNPSIF
jgi:hypothetical protein